MPALPQRVNSQFCNHHGRQRKASSLTMFHADKRAPAAAIHSLAATSQRTAAAVWSPAAAGWAAVAEASRAALRRPQASTWRALQQQFELLWCWGLGSELLPAEAQA